MEISIRRIRSFLDGFISHYESGNQLKKLMLPTFDITTEDGIKACRITDIKINKIIELTEKQFSINDIYHINYKGKEQFFMMQNLILDKYGTPLLYAKEIAETVKVNDRNTTQVFKHFYISSDVMLDTKSWICFVIRKYIIYYILDIYQCKKVHVINNREMSTMVKCKINKFTSKNIQKLKMINGDD